MATRNALTPQVQQWLHRVIQPEYGDSQNTYRDVATTLYQFPTLSPRTEVYTHEDGRPQLLLHLSGTLPVVFRGATYNIPLTIWLPHEYPKKPPMAFVTPAKDMLIRPGNHVDPSGRCYHPYLANWVNYSDRSTIVDLLDVLRQVFGREPPVYAKQQDAPTPQPKNEAPPPLPPLPPEFGKPNSPATPPTHAPVAPPPLPPLPKELTGNRQSPLQQENNTGYRNHQQQSLPPSIPPHPQQQQQQPQHRNHQEQSLPLSILPHSQQQQHHQHQHHQQPHPHSLQQGWPRNGNSRGSSLPSYQDQGPPLPSPPVPHRSNGPTPALQQPLSQHNHTPSTTSYPHPQGYQQMPTHSNFPVSGPRSPPPPHQQPPPLGRFPGGPTSPMRPTSFHSFPPPHPPHPIAPQQCPQPPLLPQKKSESVDIMSLPSTETPPLTLSAASPPPLPPNPEKDRLLREISQALHTRAEATHAKTHASLEQAAAQLQAILRAETNMERERTELARVVELCDKDAEILRERIGMAGEVIKDAESREVPGVDAVVVAPTVVHTQLYDLVTEDMAIEDTIYVLGKALDRERISLDVFLKHTRTLAREQFLLRALVKKIKRQVGIES